MEGHQSPYIALGDYTMLERNMCFSEEPGLYDPEHKCGFNWSDTIVVGSKSGYRISRVLLYERLVLDHVGRWCIRHGASDQVIDRLIRPIGNRRAIRTHAGL